MVRSNQERERNKSQNGLSSNKTRSKSRKRKDIKCYKCWKNRHIKQKCPKKKKRDTKNKEGLSKSVNVVEEEDLKSGDKDMFYVSSSSDHLPDSWILDSTCSYHMTPNKNWFDTYRLVNFGSILRGNDASCKVAGMGNIKIKMFDGVIRILCDVRYILYLRKNLISLDILDRNGFSFKSESGVMKVNKGVMTMMKRKKLVGKFID